MLYRELLGIYHDDGFGVEARYWQASRQRIGARVNEDCVYIFLVERQIYDDVSGILYSERFSQGSYRSGEQTTLVVVKCPFNP